MDTNSFTTKIQIGSRVEVKIGERHHIFLMVDDDDSGEGQQLSIDSPLGRQLQGRHLAENFHCRLWDGNIVSAEIEHIEKKVL